MNHTDVLVIGAGTAGLAAYRNAKKLHKKVKLVEGYQHGTTCARVGCMPSKLLIAASEAAHAIGDASVFGIHATLDSINGFEVMDRVRRERDRFVGFVQSDVDAFDEEDKIQGIASFIDAHTVAIRQQNGGIELWHTNTVVVATGSRPQYPAAWAVLKDKLLVNDDIFNWTTLPKSVAIFGLGVIGLEIGQALHRLGVKTLMFGKGTTIGPLSDPHVKQIAQCVFEEELNIYPDSDATIDIENYQPGAPVVVKYMHEDGTVHAHEVDYVIAATGRTPNVQGLNFQALDLPLNRFGLPDYDAETLGVIGAPHIFMAGDVNNERPLLHEASDEGALAGKNAALYPETQSLHRRSALGIVFSDPGITMVGTAYKDLPPDAKYGEVSFHNQGRSRVMAKNKGALRVYAAPDKTFLGAEMIAPRAEHIAHLLAWAHQQKMTIDQMLEMPFYHPVVEEGLRTALRDLNSKF